MWTLFIPTFKTSNDSSVLFCLSFHLNFDFKTTISIFYFQPLAVCLNRNFLQQWKSSLNNLLAWCWWFFSFICIFDFKSNWRENKNSQQLPISNWSHVQRPRYQDMFIAKECEATFDRKWSMTMHVRIHTKVTTPCVWIVSSLIKNSSCILCRRYTTYTYRITGCISKNLTLYKNACQTKLTIGKWSSLLIL